MVVDTVVLMGILTVGIIKIDLRGKRGIILFFNTVVYKIYLYLITPHK